MKGAQRVVKYLAMSFAVFLIFGIFAMIVGMGVVLGHLFGGHVGDDTEWSEVAMGDQLDFDDLTIKVKTTNVRIERGEEFQVLADEEVVSFRRDGNKVLIEERDVGLFEDWHEFGNELKIVLPKQMWKLERVHLEAGAGAVYVGGLIADEVDLDLGVGKVEIVGLRVEDRANIQGGAGYLMMRDMEVNDLSLNMGVGKVELIGKIAGDSVIEAGLGKLEMNLEGGEGDYEMRFTKGLGAITVNGEKMKDGGGWGNGGNRIKVNGGVGAIEVNVD